MAIYTALEKRGLLHGNSVFNYYYLLLDKNMYVVAPHHVETPLADGREHTVFSNIPLSTAMTYKNYIQGIVHHYCLDVERRDSHATFVNSNIFIIKLYWAK